MTHKDMFKGTTYDTLNRQVDGNHYSKMKIQPAEFINENNLLFVISDNDQIYLIIYNLDKKKIISKIGR